MLGRATTAAVSMAGFSNLVSSYGTFWATCRYGDYYNPQLLQVGRMSYFETGQGRSVLAACSQRVAILASRSQPALTTRAAIAGSMATQKG